MSRFLMPLVHCLLASVLTALPARAEDPPKMLTAEERRELVAKAKELNDAGIKAYRASKYLDAIKSFEESLKVHRQFYNTTEFPDGHPNLASSLNNLALMNQAQGKLDTAEPLYNEALEMFKRLSKGQDHPSLAQSLNHLALLYQAQGKLGAAEPLFLDALEMKKRLYKGRDHTDLALSLNNLAELYVARGKLAAAEPLFKDGLEMRKLLFKRQDHPDLATSMNNLAILHQYQGKLSAAEPLFRDALDMTKRLFNGRDDPDLARSLNNLALLYNDQSKLGAAEPLFRDALEMRKRLFKGQDHTYLAHSLSSLAILYQAQGKLGAAEPLYKEALEMHKRLSKGQDNPEFAGTVNNLAGLYQTQGKLADAKPLYEDALEMNRRLFKGQDHPDLATSMNNLGFLYKVQGKLGDAEQLYKDALEMKKRLFKGQDHPSISRSLNNLAMVYLAEGKLGDAEPLLKDALEMTKRLNKEQDHNDLAKCMNNFAALYQVQGKLGDAEPLCKDALGMYRRLAVAFAQDKTEGETLTLLAQQPITRDRYLSIKRKADLTDAYAQVWADKGYIARTYERRQLQARALATNPKAATLLDDLTVARRSRAELLFAPASKDPDTLAQRKQEIETYEVRIEKNTRDLKELLPASVRADKLASAIPADLQNALPADTAVVDFLRFIHFEHDKDKPGKAGEMRTPRYLAFVVRNEKVAWVDLGTAEKIEPAVTAWREAITGDPARKIPPASIERGSELGRKVRELIWEKVRKELPASIKTVYVCPDATLCQVPFAALPGDKPGTILLEDFAVAMIPHAPFLLDKLWPQDERKSPPINALVVGAVKYDAEIATQTPAPNASRGGDPLVTPDQKLGWDFLPNTEGEANGVAAAAERKKLTAVRLEGDKATTATVLAALPRARYAHFATHGFFADPSFRSAFQLDDKDYEKMDWGERRGRAALSPLVMTGLVFAGANKHGTPGRGIVTGEQLIDLDLSGLELAVLSACETGMGDVAGGQGTFGLQRAFHYAGTRDVIASLWKVPDQSTAALMGLFYRNLWTRNLLPLESLRQAQLEIYKNPGKIAEMAKGFRGQFKVVAGASDVEIKPDKDGTAHPLLWAAFTLSGPGR